MQWDFSIWQRAEDTWQEAHRSAHEQRLARQAEQGLERPAAVGAWVARLHKWLAAGLRRREVKKAAGTLVLLVTLAASAGPAQAAPTAAQIRALAENILGRDTVRVVRLADAGSTIVMVWVSPTFRQTNTVAATRELLYAEAAMTAGAISGVLPEVNRIRFTIVWDGRVLATGEAARVRALVVAFSAALGGGTYVPTDAPRPAVPGGDRAAQEL